MNVGFHLSQVSYLCVCLQESFTRLGDRVLEEGGSIPDQILAFISPTLCNPSSSSPFLKRLFPVAAGKEIEDGLQRATQHLKVDTRVGVGKVRAQSLWSVDYLKRTKGGDSAGKTPRRPEAWTRLNPGGPFVEPDFDARRWNLHLSIAATNELRKKIGLKPLSDKC
ncbi:hypothetical protein DIPPA_14688 [Diplonema papillatum]|nr:hypothetical protein DIPPA_14688 [Diplonema papillatum]